MTIRPAGAPPTVMSKKTLGFDAIGECVELIIPRVRVRVLGLEVEMLYREGGWVVR